MKPFLSGRTSVGNVALRPAASGSGDESLAGVRPVEGRGSKQGGDTEAHEHGPTVECIKQGDKVVKMIVTCACGERIEIECLYPAAG